LPGIQTVCETDSFRVRVLFTARSDGDFSHLSSDSGEWSHLKQVHGARIHVVHDLPIRGAEGDALVTSHERTPLSIRTADCAPILLWSAGSAQIQSRGDPPFPVVADRPSPVVAAIHAGWKGLAAGVVGACVAAMRDQGADHIDWSLGPCISAAEYEFGEDDLATMEAGFGPGVRGVTRWGTPALDLRAAVMAACSDAGLGSPDRPIGHGWPPCTASDDAYFSHRARGDTGRQVGAIWWEQLVGRTGGRP
jgi:copper oxidase (laccase) domain-containing protein